MKKKAYIILTTVLLLISPILYRPFKISAAYPLPSPFLGVNYYIYDQDFLIKYTMSGEASENTSNRNTWMCVTWDSRGCKTYQNVTTDGATYTNQSTITFNNATLTPQTQGYKAMYKLEFVLDDNYYGSFTARVYQDSSTYKTVDLVVNGTSVETQLNDINGIESITILNVDLTRNALNYNWQFPIESYPAVMPLLENHYPLYDFYQHSQWLYPIFEIKNGDWIGQSWMGETTVTNFIFIADKNWSSPSAILNNIDFGQGITIQSWQYHTMSSNISNGRLYILKLTGGTGQRYEFYAKSNFHFVPIFNARDTDYFSTHASMDFALTFDLDNSILSNLDKLANGDINSSSSVSNATTTNQQAQQTFTQEEQLVNNAEQDLQDNLDNLDIQNKNNNLFGNSKFVASAQWVKLQFDNLTNNNAFGYMITFSLVIGLALVIVGKLRG